MSTAMRKKRHGGSLSKRALLCALVVVAIASLLALSGCKYSDVLTQHTEDPDLGELDESQDPVYQPNPDSELILDLSELTIDDSDIIDTQAQMMPHYDPDAPDNGPTTQRKKGVTPHDEEATEGEEPEDEQEGDRSGEGDGDETSSGSGEKGGGSDEPSDSKNNSESDNGDDDDGNENPGENPTKDNDDELTDDELDGDESKGGAQSKNDKVVVDENAKAEDPPEGTIAAVGEYATITQMLGGKGALVASDADWLEARDSDGCFEGELDDVVGAFSGDGSESGSLDIDKLVEAAPAVLLWDGSTPQLSDEEQEEIADAGITVQAVPTLGDQTTGDDAVTEAVTEVAGIVSGIDASARGRDPVAMARNYITIHDEVLQSTYKSNKGYCYKITDTASEAILYQDTVKVSGLSDVSDHDPLSTVYVDDLYDPPVSQATINQQASVTESSITTNYELGHNGETLDVSDGVGLSAKTSTDSYMLLDFYLQLGGVVNNAYDTAKPDKSNLPYILMPGSTNDFGTSGQFATRDGVGTALFYPAGEGSVKSNWRAFGDQTFTTILVADEEIKEALESSAEKDDGLYNMQSDETYYTSEFRIVPSGIAGSWAEGHIDSFLVSPWALFSFWDSSRLDQAGTYVETFYKEMLRCSDWESVVQNWQ